MIGTNYTFKANRDLGRHGWLRLTPAYSVHLVQEFIESLTEQDRVLDPFCGSGTTALVCADRGIECETIDINPFLVWFTNAKVRVYRDEDLNAARNASTLRTMPIGAWIPPMQFIERWWDVETITALSATRQLCSDTGFSEATRDLLKIAFCQTLMEYSKANFRHQSVSLKHDISHKIQHPKSSQTAVFSHFFTTVDTIATHAFEHQPRSTPVVHKGNSRDLSRLNSDFGLNGGGFTTVVTSPPYANRMSYIRELRPYMYWLGFLQSGRQAGELDWEAIGGTWGRATSNLAKWSTESLPAIDPRIARSIAAIEDRSPVLGRYIRKYICDMSDHFVSLKPLLAPGAKVTYVVGNSRFYEFMLDTEQIFAGLFDAIGLAEIEINVLRKRTSKRELFEYAVTGRAPSDLQVGA